MFGLHRSAPVPARIDPPSGIAGAIILEQHSRRLQAGRMQVPGGAALPAATQHSRRLQAGRRGGGGGSYGGLRPTRRNLILRTLRAGVNFQLLLGCGGGAAACL